MFSNRYVAVPLQYKMKNIIKILVLVLVSLCISQVLPAQCAVCTKTALQLGEKPAQGLNTAILYLMIMPFAIVGFIGYRWWRGNRKFEEQEMKDEDRRKTPV